MWALIQTGLLQQRGGLIGWVPVCLSIGIGTYFGLDREPQLAFLMAMGASALALSVATRWLSEAIAPLCIALVLVALGFGVAKWRADHLAAPVLGFRYYGPVEGRIVGIDRSASDAIRLTLDRVVLARMSPDRTPERVRVSLHGTQVLTTFIPGDTVILTGHLSPPSGPAEPGGFNFQRHAWFLQIGAVGYTRTPVLRLSEPYSVGFPTRIFSLRMSISTAVQRAMPGDAGAFAAAVMTGDRSGISQEVLAQLRASNLAHLLAISGLHMGLLSGFVFGVMRSGLALWPYVALRFPTKKIAAAVALVAGAGYLALSGGNVATERAFIMVAVMLVAVLLGRRALTLRAVAIAATLILIWQPEVLVGPGFQMSFAATTALVVVFAALRQIQTYRLPKWGQAVSSVFLSSLIAGLATAPIAAAHFNQISHYGLIANLLSVPLMGVLVMPAAVLAACLAPLGLWQIGLWAMQQGLQWILWVAATVSSWDGALSHVPAPPPVVLPLLTLGALSVVLIQGRLRHAGWVAVLIAGLVWQQVSRPDVLIADSGGLIGVMVAGERALSKPRGDGFVAGIWLENDGAPVAQDLAAARPGVQRDQRMATVQLGPWRIIQVSGKTALAALAGCGGADVLISNQMIEFDLPCEVFDQRRLRDTGSLALSQVDGALEITPAQALVGRRLWNENGTPVGVIRLEQDQ